MRGGEPCYEPEADFSADNVHQTNSRRKSSGFSVNQLPVITSDRHEVLICRTNHEIVSPRSLSSEVRAIRDLDHFFAKPNVILDIECNSVEMIIEQMLEVSCFS